MNALELADMAECACCAYHKEIASMLRQQQAEINTLRIHGYKTQYELLRIEFLQQKAEIEKLKINYQDAMKSTCEYRNELMEERKARRKAQEK